MKTAPAVEILDGDQGFGYFVGHVAMQRALELARQSGVGLVGVNNSNHFYAGAYYVQLAAEANMIGLAMTNSYPLVAAFGGLKPVLGTNAFACGAPRRNGRSVLIDMATSASANSTVQKSIEKSEELSEVVGIDEQGRPTRNPVEVVALLPFGGAKGYCMGLMVEIFSGVLTGAGISHGVKSTNLNFQEACNNGHLFLALDITKCMPLETYYERMETLCDLLLASGAPGKEVAVRVPGEQRWLAHDQSLREGIRLDEPTVKSLGELAGTVGLFVPW
jgi:LDH2 family malate/lactate/ureidoglycolate dehydrogenase